jgi:beta-glucosidase
MELYTRPFQAAVDSGVGSAMCSYNRINNSYACENNATLSWLKDTAGFDGWVMSDWGATHSTINAALTGLDQEMPDSQYFGDALAAAVAAGEVPQSRLDDMVYRIFVAMYATGMMQNPPTGNLSANAESTARRDLARQLAEESTTLLKNDGNLLPLDLSSIRSIAILGDSATFYGGGSGGVLAPYLVTLYEALSLRLNGEMPPTRTLNCTYSNNTDFDQPPVPCYDGVPTAQACADFCNQDSTCNAFTWVPNKRCNGWGSNSGMCYIRPDASGQTSQGGNVAGICSPAPSGAVPGNKVNFTFYAGFDAEVAASLAAAADIAIVSVAISSSEGSDRTNLSVPMWQDAVVAAVAAAQPNTVAVARCPGACFMPWAADVPAILYSLLPGQEAATALANILVGDVTPSGKLPVSFPGNMSDTWLGNPVNPEQYPGTQRTNSWIEADYSEGLFIGYRWYDSTGIKPLWPFGHGLSYANFTYSNLSVNGSPSPTSNVTISFQIANIGDADGQEVPQLYVGYPAAANEPPKLLKDFTKVMVESGSQHQITFTLTAQQLSVFDLPTAAWLLVPGTYTVLVGSSSADIRLTGTFTA